MLFHEKLQALRKTAAITQEELAQRLYVSRTAISKWESGKGYPSIDSLKLLAKFYQISIDELLSNEELVEIAILDNEDKSKRMLDLTFGLLNMLLLVLFFFPFFGYRTDDGINEVSLINFNTIQKSIIIIYYLFVIIAIVLGILFLALQGIKFKFWDKHRYSLSFIILFLLTIVFIITLQPYAASLTLIILIIEVFLRLNIK